MPDSKQNKPSLGIVYDAAGQNIHAAVRLTHSPSALKTRYNCSLTISFYGVPGIASLHCLCFSKFEFEVIATFYFEEKSVF